MATQNDFLPFATGPGANVVDQATYAALGALTTGFLSGTAQSMQLNKVWRQSSIVAAVIAQFIVAQTGQAAVDDGTTATLLANFTKAVNAASKPRVILPDSGSVNAYAAANPVPMTSLPTVGGIVQTISVKTTNTGASTYSPDGLPSRPIYGLGGGALQGGELVANGIATLVSYVGPLLNGGALCWVLIECIGGAQQVAPATQSQHAVQMGQLYGGLKGIARFTSSGSWTVPAGVTQVWLSGCAGGGGGGNGGAASSGGTLGWSGGGGGGGAGQPIVRQPFAVVPGTTISITVGAAGSGAPVSGSGTGNSGGSGGNTVISGAGWNGGTSTTLTGGSGGGGGAFTSTAGSNATGGGPGTGYPSGGYGNDTTNGNASGSGGTGASGPFGGGGAAARASTSGVAGLAAYGFGAGGGGGSGVYNSGTGNGGAGGNGAPGLVILEW
ncbi:hypothetical protein KTD18_16330 [Burkholderia multivorans]|uniref:glycine-rich domain-containing protein n=1 Tax=Burkholderia multivorans TaxID=87883 RepID=UPI001C22A789|nr:hypothetical protein [Burkholderia multivorans]MBU9293117.1 hypothetical protein [Burkholderia multivorans]